MVSEHRAHIVDERSDGVSSNEPLHPPVPDEEVRRAGVLVKEQRVCAELKCLYDARGHGCASARVLCREGRGACPGRERGDERGDVDAGYGPAIFSLNGDEVRRCHEKFATVCSHLDS